MPDSKKSLRSILDKYDTGGFYDEIFESNSQVRSHAEPLTRHINSLNVAQLKKKQNAAELALLQQGVTFSVYGNQQGTEKVFPFDILPRIISASEWSSLEAGLKERVDALNLFIHDVYNEQKVLKDGIVPKELVLSSDAYLKQCRGIKPPKNIWAHISGTDLIRDAGGTFCVLEDNLRCPSGISYVLQNRIIQKRIFPAALGEMCIRPVSDYISQLYSMLRFIGSQICDDPTVVVLTPGIYNSAYFEHTYLAQQMGVTLAEGRDLAVKDGNLVLRTTRGYERVAVVYRRIDDAFLDSNEFNPDSLLGVAGIMDCFRKGRVALVNAPGAGIADDKAVYAYIPAIIKYYLDKDPIIPNIPTYLCSHDQQRSHVIENLKDLVVKPTNGSGGYGMLIGSNSTASERKEFASKISADPRGYIAQPIISLSRSPTIIKDRVEGRHVDLRPYTLYGSSMFTLPGGLTRVALRKDSLVVNSSQGGGSKDTWVLADSSNSRERL